MTEGITTEFKREYTEDIKKTVIAFANTRGGEILIGVEDDGTVIGVPDVDETMLKATNALRDSIKPDITIFLLCEKHCSTLSSIGTIPTVPPPSSASSMTGSNL